MSDSSTDPDNPLRRDGDALRVGVFDSGVGGLTVLRALRTRFPEVSLVYLGDTARLPYGTKSRDTVRRYTERNVRFLVDQGVDVVVVACNSASALALPLDDSSSRPGRTVLPAEVSPKAAVSAARAPVPAALVSGVPVLGVIGPGARAAARVSEGRVGVLATEATVRSGAYSEALGRERPSLRVWQVACPLLVPLVEEGWIEDDITEAVARRYLGPLTKNRVDTVVLGCTHYPLLAPMLNRVLGSSVRLVESGAAVADELAPTLNEIRRSARTPGYDRDRRFTAGSLELFVTDGAERFATIAERVLGHPCDLKWVDV